jgi:plastocyanin
MKVKLILPIIFIFAFIVYFLFNVRQKNSSVSDNISTENMPTTSAPIKNESIISTNKIEYIDDGFFPKEITIKKGRVITFINKGNNLMWVASDDHPSHMIYPEFDAKRGYSNQEYFTFTFDKIGKWGYHNHLKSSDKATIIVEE